MITNFSDIKNPSNLYWSQECSEKVRLGLKIAELAKGASEKKIKSVGLCKMYYSSSLCLFLGCMHDDICNTGAKFFALPIENNKHNFFLPSMAALMMKKL